MLPDAYVSAVIEADSALSHYYTGVLTPVQREKMSDGALAALRTVAFPVLSGGSYRGAQPPRELLEIAIGMLRSARTTFIRHIQLVILPGDADMEPALSGLGHPPSGGFELPHAPLPAPPGPARRPAQPGGETLADADELGRRVAAAPVPAALVERGRWLREAE